MILREKFESSGRWLFRWRSYLPLFLLGLAFLAMAEYEYPWGAERWNHLWEVVCLGVSFLGLVVRAFTIGHTPRGTSGRNTRVQVADSLNTTGIYSVVRNPLYLGNFFLGLGPALMVHEWWLTVIYILAFWIYYERIIYAEEAFLEGKFGDRFTEWARETPCIVPKLRGYRKPDLNFSLKNVLRREYNGFFAVVVVLFLLETVADLSALGRFDWEKEWIVLVAFSFAMWLTLRTLKRHTRLLKVDGR